MINFMHHQVVHEIDHMSDLHVDSSFYKQSMKIDNNHKIKQWINYSIGQSTAIQEVDKKRPTLSDLNQTQNRRRYIKFENGSHFICSLNLNNSQLTVFVVFKMTNIASENQSFFNSLIVTTNEHGSQNSEFYFRTVFHFRTNHEAAGSRTGSGVFRHVPRN